MLQINQRMKIGSLIILSFLFYSCGPIIFKSANLNTAIAQHKKVAVLPAEITWDLDKIDSKNLSLEKIGESERRSGLEVQKYMSDWLTKNKANFSVAFQDISTTNQTLYEAGLKYADIKSTPKQQLAKLLNVDGLLYIKLISTKPLSDIESVFIGLSGGTFGQKPDSRIYTNIYDGLTGSQLWRYDYTPSNTFGMKLERIVKNSMGNIAKKFPYKK